MSLVEQAHQAKKERDARIWAAAQRLEDKKVAERKKLEAAAAKVAAAKAALLKGIVARSIPITDSDKPEKIVPRIFKNRRTLKRIMRNVADKYSLTENDIISPSRNPTLCAARFEYCYRAMVETTLPLNAIGRSIDRDHSTIIHAVSTHCNDYGLTYPRGAQWPKWRKAVAHV